MWKVTHAGHHSGSHQPDAVSMLTATYDEKQKNDDLVEIFSDSQYKLKTIHLLVVHEAAGQCF